MRLHHYRYEAAGLQYTSFCKLKCCIYFQLMLKVNRCTQIEQQIVLTYFYLQLAFAKRGLFKKSLLQIYVVSTINQAANVC